MVGLQQHRAHHRPAARGEPARDPRGQEALSRSTRVIVSLMVETQGRLAGHHQAHRGHRRDGLELNFGCPHGMCERGMGSAVGQEPEVLEEITGWAVEFSTIPVLVKLTPNIGDILEAGVAGGRGRRARALADQHDQEHRSASTSTRIVPVPGGRRPLDQRRLLRPGGQADRAPHGGGARARPAHQGADLGHRRHRHLARRGRVHRARLDQRPGLHRGDALRLPHRRGHDRGPLELPRREGHEVGERAARQGAAGATSSGATSTSTTRSSPRSIPTKCIGCHLCYVACRDTAVHCIHNVDEPLEARPRRAHPRRTPSRRGEDARRAHRVGRRDRVHRLQPLLARCARCRAASR